MGVPSCLMSSRNLKYGSTRGYVPSCSFYWELGLEVHDPPQALRSLAEGSCRNAHSQDEPWGPLAHLCRK